MLRTLLLILLAIGLAACNAAPDLRASSPSHKKSAAPSKKIIVSKSLAQKKTLAKKNSPGIVVIKEKAEGKLHQVKKGETLFSIAWSYGEDYKALAKNNNISEPFTIYADQQLVIAACQAKAASDCAGKSQANKPIVGAHDEKSQDNHKVIQKKDSQSLRNKVEVKNQPSMRWIWPVQGKIIKGFAIRGVALDRMNKGIDIAGRPGSAVKAAAPGKVVYSGHGLVGYGNLIILKHDDTFLSAYAHNRRLLVREGDQVKAGQKIAEIGSTGASAPGLHFEIRRAGEPIDPLEVLPQK